MELTQSLASISVATFLCFVGLPVWWQTTKVYRANLPYAEILTLNMADHDAESIKLKWNVFVDETLLQSESTALSSFKDAISVGVKEIMPRFDMTLAYEILNTDTLSKLVSNITTRDDNKIDQRLINLMIENIENLTYPVLHHGNDHFHHELVFLKMPHHFSKAIIGNRILFFGNSNVIVLLDNIETENLKSIINCTVSSIKDILYPKFDTYTDMKNREKETKEIPLQSSSGLDISFTLANSDPFAYVVDWNIEKAISSELMPFLEKISDFGTFSITSQILNFVDVGIIPKKHKDGGYFYSMKKLPLLINPLESRLNEYTSNNPILNFVFYVPQAAHVPLTIRSKGLSYMSFTSPRWGGVIIKNLYNRSFEKNATLKNTELNVNKIEMESDMKTIVLQFRELIGLKRTTIGEVMFASVDKSGIMKWEIDYLLLKGTMANLEKSTSTLVSLASLLGTIANIVIRDDIKSLIDDAIYDIKSSKSFLVKGQLRKAFIASKSAVVRSEKAFYDHSLLALLYFPDDQKYAIYLPLFLPIFIPLFLSVIFAVNTVVKNYKKI